MQEGRRIPKWLEQLQENSWELELLISGGAIFSLFHISDLFLDFVFTLKMASQLPGTGIFIMIGMLGIKMLTFGFITHLILRAFWLGLVCLNYVFPGGTKEEKERNSTPFYRKGLSGKEDLKNEIIQVDRASGLIMFISIISVAYIFGSILAIILLITIPAKLIELSDIYFICVVMGYVFYTIDLLSFGAIRKLPYLSYLFWPIFKLFDLLTLRKFYQKGLRLFRSNIKKWKAVLGFTMLILFSVVFTYVSIYRVMHWPNIIDERAFRWSMAPGENWISHTYYMDKIERDGIKYAGPAIQSEIVHDNYLIVFVPYNVRFDADLESVDYISESIGLKLNGELYDSVEWYNTWDKDIDQIGVRTHLDISELENGKNELLIYNTVGEGRVFTIPFWKDVR